MTAGIGSKSHGSRLSTVGRKTYKLSASKYGVFSGGDGFALIMVLFITALLSVVSLGFLNSSRWNTLSTHNLKEETLSYYLAVSGYNEAINYLMSDKDASFDLVDGEGNFLVDDETPPVTGKRSTEDGDMEIKIIDEDSRININNVSNTNRLKNLFEYSGIPNDEITGIIDSMKDWIDRENKIHHLAGAEDDYYESLDDPYHAKNTMFSIPEELALVKGMTHEYLYGSGETKPLLPLITTFGARAKININTVSSEVMELLGLDSAQIEAVYKQRNEDIGGFRSLNLIPNEIRRKGLNTIASNNFRIEVTATAGNSKTAAKIVAVLKRSRSAGGYKFNTVYWRESAENIRS